MIPNLSTKQYKYAKYLLHRISFTNPKLEFEYIEKLKNIYTTYNAELGYSNSDCIQELITEVEIKKKSDTIKLKDFCIDSKISATDVSNFLFCPASYSISKSFEVERYTNGGKKFLGIELHESLRLIDKAIPEYLREKELYDTKVLKDERINKIKNCELIFSGHQIETKFFINNENNFIGQPDYIFKDPKGNYFVVEEKFKHLSSQYQDIENYVVPKNSSFDYSELTGKYNLMKKVKSTFFTNHVIQVESYMQFIKEYPLKYGVLIYWFYDFHGEIRNVAKVHNVSLKVIKKNDNLNLLKETRGCNLNSV